MAPLIFLLATFAVLFLVNRFVLTGRLSTSFIGRASMAVMLLVTGVSHFTNTAELDRNNAGISMAIIFGLIGRREAKHRQGDVGMAVAGIIAGATGLIACSVGVLLTVAVAGAIDRYDHPAPHRADVVSCEIDDRVATATVAITNLGDDVADFSVQVQFVRAGTGTVNRSIRSAVDDLGAGQSRTLVIERNVSLDTVDCRVAQVTGPLPFGLEVP
jgi:hypothetical protein